VAAARARGVRTEGRSQERAVDRGQQRLMHAKLALWHARVTTHGTPLPTAPGEADRFEKCVVRSAAYRTYAELPLCAQPALMCAASSALGGACGPAGARRGRLPELSAGQCRLGGCVPRGRPGKLRGRVRAQ
jgi:hypothetical protein